MELAVARAALPSPLRSSAIAALRPLATASVTYPARSALTQQRQFHVSPRISASNNNQFGMPGSMPSYFAVPRAPSLPSSASVIRFVPQQTAWVVERMGKFSRILPPGLAILIPFIDRIAYVKSLKEATFDIPSQSAITADNVTLELDGVLYTRVFDAYKAR
jgi:SPFH domain / Band 7 family